VLLWLGGAVSLTGDWALVTGLPLVVYAMTGSTLALGATAIAAALPRLLLGSVAGVFVDRWDRRLIVLGCNVLLGLALVPLLSVRSVDDLWLITLVLLVESSVFQFYRPAEIALVPRLVSADELASANALNGVSMNLARLAGPALGALLVATTGLIGIVLVDIASFAFAAVTVLLLKVDGRPLGERPDTQPLRVLQQWRAGLRVVSSHRTQRLLVLFIAMVGVGEGITATLLVPFSEQLLHGDEFTYGALLSAQAVGGLVGSALVAQFASRLSPTRLLQIGAVLLGLIDLLIFYTPLLTPIVAVPLALMVLVGLPAAAITPSYLTIVQTNVPDEQRGRVLGLGFATLALSGMIGMALAGALGDLVGVLPLLTIQSVGYVMGGGLVLSRLR
jgi:Na+/melibiose symporter-like transporter